MKPRTAVATHGQTTLVELALLFLRLGTTAFGGPAAHIAMLEDEVVKRRQWLTEERFLDLLGATNLIPGPNSTEMAIHVGWARRRWSGLVVAGLAFILPAMLITIVLGWAYMRFGHLPAAGWMLYGIKPVILSVVVQAIWSLMPKAAKTVPLGALGACGALLSLFGANELALLFGTGILSVILTQLRTNKGANNVAGAFMPFGPSLVGAAVNGITLNSLFWVFFKTGSVLFGSGYVLLAFLRADLVERLHWLTEAQLLDAIAAGQVTPGPVFTTATFIGYIVSGPTGALVATAGIFLPAFVFVAISGPLVPKLRGSATIAAFLDGVNVASLALMAVVTLELGRAALVDVPTFILGLASAVMLVRFRANSTWLILGGVIVGWTVHALGLAAN